jgi:hypothetical protein
MEALERKENMLKSLKNLPLDDLQREEDFDDSSFVLLEEIPDENVRIFDEKNKKNEEILKKNVKALHQFLKNDPLFFIENFGKYAVVYDQKIQAIANSSSASFDYIRKLKGTNDLDHVYTGAIGIPDDTIGSAHNIYPIVTVREKSEEVTPYSRWQNVKV